MLCDTTLYILSSGNGQLLGGKLDLVTRSSQSYAARVTCMVLLLYHASMCNKRTAGNIMAIFLTFNAGLLYLGTGCWHVGARKVCQVAKSQLRPCLVQTKVNS